MISKRDVIEKCRPIKKEFYCIYALIKNKNIVYIGQTSNIISRLSSHLHSNKDFDSWSVIESFDYIESDSFNKLEKKYINKFKPKLNVQFRIKKKRTRSSKSI